ncbi:unnamed protein product [Ectocarpus fasciculatus]
MRRMFFTFTAVLVAVACAGLSRNAGSKFVRTRVQQGCRRNYANVATAHSRENPSLDLVCCTGSAEDDAVCIGGQSRSTKTLASKLAFAIPLAALAVNAFCDWLAGGATPSRTRARWNRFLLYLAVILGRTLGMYLGLNYIQDLVQSEESSNCWYAHLRRSGKCSEHFDFADHVVLAVCQYYAIQASKLSPLPPAARGLSPPGPPPPPRPAKTITYSIISLFLVLVLVLVEITTTTAAITAVAVPVGPSRRRRLRGGGGGRAAPGVRHGRVLPLEGGDRRRARHLLVRRGRTPAELDGRCGGGRRDC